MNAAARLHAQLYGPTPAELVASLPTVADVLHERLVAIHDAPTVADVDAALRELGGLTATLMKLRLALVQEGGSNG